MNIVSPAFADSQLIPAVYACDGANISPPLSISDVPAGARTLVLIVDDPDAPAGDWVHWTLWNISPDRNEIAEDHAPEEAMEGMTDFGHSGYGGPCPPSSTHRYQFKLYALDTALDLPLSARKADIEKAIKDHIIGNAILVGLYRRG